MPSGTNGPGIRRAIIIMILVLAGLAAFFAWNYQLNQRTAGVGSDAAGPVLDVAAASA